MPNTDEQPNHSAISAQAFELLKVVFTLVLTGVIGGGITYYYQTRSHREQQESQELETARQSALSFLREVGDILEQRRHHAFRVLYSVRDNAPPDEKEQVWRDYMNSVNAWNMKWNLYRALVLEQFGPDMQKRFYDEKADAEGVWEKCSITGKLIMLHNMLTDFQKQSPDKPAKDPKQIEQLYSSISQDCYAFYSEVISRIQEGRVGKRSWAAGLLPAAVRLMTIKANVERSTCSANHPHLSPLPSKGEEKAVNVERSTSNIQRRMRKLSGPSRH